MGENRISSHSIVPYAMSELPSGVYPTEKYRIRPSEFLSMTILRKITVVAALTLSLLTGCQKPLDSATPSASATPDISSTPESIAELVTYLSPKSTVDKLYPSMMGPFHLQNVAIDPQNKDKIWFTGFRATMIAGETDEPYSQEYNCHADVQLPMRPSAPATSREDIIFTISQGQTTIEFPEGFGIPLSFNEPISVGSQVLNLNTEPKVPFDVRHKLDFRFVRDSKLEQPLKALVPAQVVGYKAISEAALHYGVDKPDPSIHGGGCLRGDAVIQRNIATDEHGNEFTAHWYVSPGREENRTLVTRYLNLKYDTTVHYIAAHLHPFAEYAELRDLTTGEVIFHCEAKQTEGKIGLAHVDHFSSVEGVPLYADHEYELVSVYNNTSDEPQDAMVVFYMYLLDKKPSAEPPTITG